MSCLGYWSGFDPRDFDCEYPFAASINCEDCIFGGHGGKKDPRINPEWKESQVFEEGDIVMFEGKRTLLKTLIEMGTKETDRQVDD